MTNPKLTYLTGIMDRSGSMSSIKDDTEGGWRTLLAEQAAQPGDCRVSLVQFDTAHELVYDYTPIAAAPDYRLVPRGGTALLDAIGFTVTRLGERLAALPEPERPGAVIVVILTDGHENSSKEWDYRRVGELIAHQQDRYQWVFQFLGANQDAILTARGLGIQATHAVTYTAGNVHDTLLATSANVAAYRAGTAAGLSHGQSVAASAYTDAQRAAAVGEEQP